MNEAEKLYRDLHANKRECVKVVVRVRPMSKDEIQNGHKQITIVNSAKGTIQLVNPDSDDRDMDKTFTFDGTFDGNSIQKEVFERTTASIVENVLEGYNGTIFCYGQTGSGKTHTMEGYPDPPELKGLMPLSFKYIFDSINLAVSEGQKNFMVRASYLEIYNEDVKDLLSTSHADKLEIKENSDSGVYVKDLTCKVVKNVQEIDLIQQQGKQNRATGETNMNKTSSRSHSIFTIIVEQSTKNDDGTEHYRVGKLNLVDLAGSERASKTGAQGDRLKEGININQSLSTLGNVIKALVDGKSTHVPYRDSKLTRLLQDSLGGNTKTCMIANCGPASYNYEETLSTLRYADRAKRIKNKPVINEDPKDAMLREFQEEIIKLRNQLARKTGQIPLNPDGSLPEGYETNVIEKTIVKEKELDQQQLEEFKRKAREENEKKLKEIEDKIKHTESSSKNQREEFKLTAQLEKQRLLEEKESTLKEREAIERQLKTEEMERMKQFEENQKLLDQLQEMEGKVLDSDKLENKLKQQDLILLKQQRQLDAEKRREELLAEKLAREEDERLMLQDVFTSKEEECKAKRKKLQRIVSKLKQCEQDMVDAQREAVLDREDYEALQNQIQGKIELNKFIIAHFIPQEIKNELLKLAVFDEMNDSYSLPHLELAGNNIQQSKPTPSNESKEDSPVNPISNRQINLPDEESKEVTRRDRANRPQSGLRSRK